MRCVDDDNGKWRGKIEFNAARIVLPPIFAGGENTPSGAAPPRRRRKTVLGGRRPEGRFARNVARAFPATQSAQRGPGTEGFDQGDRGGELVDGLGDERVREPDARTRRSSVAAPFVAVGEAPQFSERNDFTKLPIQGGKFPQFVGEGRKELAVQAVEDRGEVEHVLQTNSPRPLFIGSENNPNKMKF